MGYIANVIVFRGYRGPPRINSESLAVIVSTHRRLSEQIQQLTRAVHDSNDLDAVADDS